MSLHANDGLISSLSLLDYSRRDNRVCLASDPGFSFPNQFDSYSSVESRVRLGPVSKRKDEATLTRRFLKRRKVESHHILFQPVRPELVTTSPCTGLGLPFVRDGATCRRCEFVQRTDELFSFHFYCLPTKAAELSPSFQHETSTEHSRACVTASESSWQSCGLCHTRLQHPRALVRQRAIGRLKHGEAAQCTTKTTGPSS